MASTILENKTEEYMENLEGSLVSEPEPIRESKPRINIEETDFQKGFRYLAQTFAFAEYFALGSYCFLLSLNNIPYYKESIADIIGDGGYALMHYGIPSALFFATPVLSFGAAKLIGKAIKG